MRNYIEELRELGHSFDAIAKETGLSPAVCRHIEKGSTKLVSGSARYEAVRNASRRLSYRHMRESGYDVEEAQEWRRSLADPEAEVRLEEKVVKARSLFPATLYKIWIMGLFRQLKSGVLRVSDGESMAHKELDWNVHTAEAIDTAKRKLDGSWELVKIIATEVRKVVLEARE